MPALDLLLFSDGCFNIVMNLEPYEPLTTILAREAGEYLFPMLPYPGNQIGCDTRIERAVALGRHDVNIAEFHDTEHIQNLCPCHVLFR